MVLLVTYDLIQGNDKPENYSRLIDGIKGLFPVWCHIEKSVWVIETHQAPGDVREALKPYINTGDRLFVAALNGRWSSWNLGDNRNKWLHNRKDDF